VLDSVLHLENPLEKEHAPYPEVGGFGVAFKGVACYSYPNLAINRPSLTKNEVLSCRCNSDD
jgi:hypothetical protein